VLEQLFNNPELDFNLETLAQFMDKYRAKWIVAKLGGSLMDQPEAVKHILSDVAKLVNMGSYPLIVNGGGKDIDRELVKHNIITIFTNKNDIVSFMPTLFTKLDSKSSMADKNI